MAELQKTKYQAEVLVEIEITGDDQAAYEAVDTIMQRAWETDDGRTWAWPKWHFEMLEGCVNVIEPAEVTDETTKEIS